MPQTVRTRMYRSCEHFGYLSKVRHIFRPTNYNKCAQSPPHLTMSNIVASVVVLYTQQRTHCVFVIFITQDAAKSGNGHYCWWCVVFVARPRQKANSIKSAISATTTTSHGYRNEILYYFILTLCSVRAQIDAAFICTIAPPPPWQVDQFKRSEKNGQILIRFHSFCAYFT